MSNRLIPVDLKASKTVKELMKEANNDTERKRISIVYQYLWWWNMNSVCKMLLVWNQTAMNAIHGYIDSPELFFKTQYRGRRESEEIKKIKKQTQGFIKKKQEEWQPIDINDVKYYLEKQNNQEFKYANVHWLVRYRLKMNYQKPYVTSNKQSKHAKNIAEWRLRKAIYQVGCEEWEIDAESIKNKKTKIWEFKW